MGKADVFMSSSLLIKSTYLQDCGRTVCSCASRLHQPVRSYWLSLVIQWLSNQPTRKTSLLLAFLQHPSHIHKIEAKRFCPQELNIVADRYINISPQNDIIKQRTTRRIIKNNGKLKTLRF